MRIIFEFVGGSRDGQTDVGNSDQPFGPDNMALGHYFLTEQGTIGKRFWTATPYALERLQTVGPQGGGHAEKNEVIERLDAAD